MCSLDLCAIYGRYLVWGIHQPNPLLSWLISLTEGGHKPLQTGSATNRSYAYFLFRIILSLYMKCYTMRTWEDNIIMDLRETGRKLWTGCICLRGPLVCSCEHSKRWRISWTNEPTISFSKRTPLHGLVIAAAAAIIIRAPVALTNMLGCSIEL